MLNPDGVGITTIDGTITQENDSFQCGHCGAHKYLKPKEPPYATCKKCMGFLCEYCYGQLMQTGICKPQEQWLLEQERKITSRVQFENDWKMVTS